jgi:pimeloyl-ACP methyl ester carboxylesterase
MPNGSESDRFLEALLADDVATVRGVLGGEAGSLILPPYGFVPRDTEGRIEFVLTPWYRSQVAYRAAGVAERIRAPVFAAYGALDRVIDPERSLQLLREALGPDRPDDRLERVEGLNHLLMPAQTGSPLEYAYLPELITAPLWDSIVDWIGER